MTNVAKVSEIFQCAATAFGRLAHLTLDLKMCQEQGSDSESKNSGKWTVVEVDQLKDAVSRFGNDLNRIAEMIETKSLNQIRHKIRSKVFQDAGYAPPPSSTKQIGTSNIVIQSINRNTDVVQGQPETFERLRRKQPLEEASGRYIIPVAKRNRFQHSADVNEANTSNAGDIGGHQTRQYLQQKHEIARSREGAETGQSITITPPVTATSVAIANTAISTTVPANAATVIISNTPLRTATTGVGSGGVLVRGPATTNFVTVSGNNLLATSAPEPTKRSPAGIPSLGTPGSQTQRVVRLTSSAPSEGHVQCTAPKTGAVVPRIVGSRFQIRSKVEPRKEKMQQQTSYVKRAVTGPRDEYADYDDEEEDEDAGEGEDEDVDEDVDGVVARYDDEEDDLDEEEEEDEEDDILDAGQRDDYTDDEDYIVGRR